MYFGIPQAPICFFSIFYYFHDTRFISEFYFFVCLCNSASIPALISSAGILPASGDFPFLDLSSNLRKSLKRGVEV